MLAKVEAPVARMYDEHLGGVVAVLRIDAPRRLSCAADVKAVRLGDVDILLGILRYARADDREILFRLGPRGAGVDKRIVARPQIDIANQARVNLRR